MQVQVTDKNGNEFFTVDAGPTSVSKKQAKTLAAAVGNRFPGLKLNHDKNSGTVSFTAKKSVVAGREGERAKGILEEELAAL